MGCLVMDVSFVVQRFSSSEWAVVDSYGFPVKIFSSFDAAEAYCLALRSKFLSFLYKHKHMYDNLFSYFVIV